jgi:hypothetical protein
MFTLSLDRLQWVLRLKFSGLFTAEDLDAIDPALVRFLGTVGGARQGIRGLYDMTEVQALAVPQTRFAEWAGKPAIGNPMRVVSAPPWAGEEFGQTYRQARSMWSHAQPIIVGTLPEAYAFLGVLAPRFEPLP